MTDLTTVPLAFQRRIRPERLRRFAAAALEQVGVEPQGALQVAEVLAAADRRGVHSHGVFRLPAYVEAVERGLVETHPTITVERETAVSALVDGGNGFGALASRRAMGLCIEKAQTAGLAAVAVHGSTHNGMMAYYSMMALPHNMIGFAATNANTWVAPTGAAKKAFGTNPLTVAVPAGEERPFVLDMATSVVSHGKIATRHEQGLPLPLGWGLDGKGRPTTDGHQVLNGGSILPLGGLEETSGYKGYGLSMLVDLLCGPLTGSLFGVAIQSWLVPGRTQPYNVGHFFAALRVDLFRPLEEFKADVDRLIRQTRGLPKAPGVPRIYVAGEKEWENDQQSQELGIPLPIPEREALARLADRLGLQDLYGALEG
ncbi:MAG: Ldh family oxidoreductase [Chloroflexi bacterium]|nr:Ldh family oxidoreductase [Chloroflexota bacterium]